MGPVLGAYHRQTCINLHQIGATPVKKVKPTSSANKECEIKNTGHFCFENTSKIKVWVTIWDSQRVQRDLTLDPNQTQCFYDLIRGSYHIYLVLVTLGEDADSLVEGIC